MLRKLLFTLTMLLFVTACDTNVTAPAEAKELVIVSTPTTADAFDEFGYNDVANIFNGAADGVDRALDGKVWGDPTYANDHLVMKWNRAWETCNANRTPANCTGAWINNEWNGQVEGGSGESWHYKIVWVGSCGAAGTPRPDGSYCIWNEYAVLMSQGSVDGTHFWDAHAKPNGLGLAP